MPEVGSFLQELDAAVSRGSTESRLRALWHATDLLMAGQFTEDQTWIFGEVIGRLADQIEVAARAKLATRLADTGNAPHNIINKLAFDDSIDVAGPVLQRSARIDARTLLANARSKSQQHLLAISNRKSLSEEVTDVLVTRGSQEVIHSVAANHGAHFSDSGFLHMFRRSETDSILAEHLGHRRDIPRHLFQQLIAKASDEVKRKLESELPEMESQIKTSVADATGALHSKFGPASKQYFAAKKLVLAAHRCGNINEKKILEYAQSHKFEESAVALSLLCSLPVDVVERALIDKNREMLLVVTKAIGFSWATTMSLLFLGAPEYRICAQDLDEMEREFVRLNVETSRSVLQLYQLRKNAKVVDSGERRLPQLHA